MIPCKAARKYARAVGRHLVCPASRRARLKQLIQHSVDAYLEEKPEAGFPDLVRDIGTPKLFAESLLTGLPADEVDAARRFRKNRSRIVIAVLTAIVSTAFVLLALFYWKYQDAMRGQFIVDEIWVVAPDDMTDEEFKEYNRAILQKYIDDEDRRMKADET
ncbi:hypothetical protein D3Z48_01935 [Clostridiaceae bacterium]|nr:hypothetical protein [Clostridiaceae bacterium]RKJ83196.1 hypothetical protein D7X33_00340 [Butyricicoccus sp. 1XD8-22]